MTCQVLGPLVIFFWPPWTHISADDFFDEFALVVISYLFFSTLPLYFLLWLGVHLIDRKAWHVWTKKLVATQVSLILVLITWVVTHWNHKPFNWGDAPLYGMYALPLVAGVWIWRWPGRGEAGREEPAG